MKNERGASPSDGEILGELAAGKEERFHLLVARYERRVATYLKSYFTLGHRAEDITQETFLNRYPRLPWLVRCHAASLGYQNHHGRRTLTRCVAVFRDERDVSHVATSTAPTKTAMNAAIPGMVSALSRARSLIGSIAASKTATVMKTD